MKSHKKGLAFALVLSLTEFSKKSTTSTGGSDAKHHEDELLFFIS